ncbi:hypothetical protein G7Y29_01845 [Corynebacterium qintianiae]|uniref:Uncharacterized protein n=1 Tax=Corynebacterium qintianiae TaxID=2709392 RepID=A0A7T0KN71_9CORY|nr:hypothetical protein [Corynebacterium qintianiae]QPK83579.1 hypothetical protein G7Y29_01845 [Corynebacterium qintianiae]
MTAVTANIDSLAAEAASVPGADPATLSRIFSLADEINSQYRKIDGMNLEVVSASSGRLLGSGGGSSSGSRGGGIGGFLLKFAIDVVSKIGADGASSWFHGIGVSGDEDGRENAEETQGNNAREIHHDVQAACRSMTDIDLTANTAIGGVTEVMAGLLAVVRIHPVGRAVAIVLPLVAQGMEQILGIVEDRNTQMEGCLGAVTDRCNAMLDHQPALPREWECPVPAARDCETARPTTPDAPCPTPGAPAVTAPATEECIERLVKTVPSALDEVKTQAASVAASAPVNIAFDFDVERLPQHTVEKETVSCPPTCADAALFVPPEDTAEVCHVGVLAHIGLGITLECVNYLAECIAEAAECPGESCCAHTEETSEECPPPPEPEPAPAPVQPPVAEGTIPPPPELAQVEEPPAPAEKLRAAGLDAPAPAPAAPPPPVEPAPAPEPAPASGDTPKMRKSGEW